MKGYEQIDHSVIWENGSRTYTNGGTDPPHSWQYPPQNTLKPVEIADETPAQSGGGYQVPASPVVQAKPPVMQTPPIYNAPPPPAQVNQPPTAPQGVAVGEPAPGTSPPPPAPPPMPTMDQTLGSIGAWWSGLSNGTKIAAGALGAGALIAVLARGSSTP